MSRQNYYAQRRRGELRQIDEGRIVQLVGRERQQQPRLGARKLLYLLQQELFGEGIRIGRDRFLDVLRGRDLLVKRRRKGVRTTYSRHALPVYVNRLKEMSLSGPNQAWVADLTYLRTEEGFVYASLITDAYSSKIVGYNLGDTLESEGCLKALKMATQQLAKGQRVVHHSDRGCQYCSHRYIEQLRRHGMEVSMTEVNHCYENAKAERVNGILKEEYYLDRMFVTKAQARASLKQAVELYNHRRPHLSLNYAFPAQVHARGTIPGQAPLWRARREGASVPAGHFLRKPAPIAAGSPEATLDDLPDSLN